MLPIFCWVLLTQPSVFEKLIASNYDIKSKQQLYLNTVPFNENQQMIKTNWPES